MKELIEIELNELIKKIITTKAEFQTVEIKKALDGTPAKLYDTLSSFSNQDDGGIIVFGIDEQEDYSECGIYDSQDIQKRIVEQCKQMNPVVRPLLSVVEKDNKSFVSAEIPGIDISDRPCYYLGQGRLKGSYVRVGDSDEPMTEYEVYSYEAFRKKYQDDVRTVPRATFKSLDKTLLDEYIQRLKNEKPNLSNLDDEEIYELMSITHNDKITLSSILLFCKYPQAYFPQLCITAISLPSDEIGETGPFGERFLDNQRIEGNIPQMLEQAITFIKRNIRTKTIINPITGVREDRTDYPIAAIREAILNTLVHRDYSIHTEGMPIQIIIYPNRIEIINPGGIYGRLKIDQLGKVQPDTRNPVLATALEVLDITENRYSGIPTIRKTMSSYGLQEPLFMDRRGNFSVTLYNEPAKTSVGTTDKLNQQEKSLLEFLQVQRSRKEITDFLKISSTSYAIQTYVMPLVQRGLVKLTIPERPKSQAQRYFSVFAEK